MNSTAQVARIAHVDHAHAVRKQVADISEALFDHDLHSVGPPTLVAVTDELHVFGVLWRFKIRHFRSLVLIQQNNRGEARPGHT
jgi:hypothetical protein